MLHKLREFLVRQRTALISALHGHLAEYGTGLMKLEDLTRPQPRSTEMCDNRVKPMRRPGRLASLGSIAILGFLAAGASAAGSPRFVAAAQPDKPPAGFVTDLRGIAPAIAACWHPPHEGDAITLRLSFRRDGSVFGRPRITYSQASGGADGTATLANSIFAALAACTPLPLSPQLGAAIAGRVFLIRFIAPRKEQKA